MFEDGNGVEVIPEAPNNMMIRTDNGVISAMKVAIPRNEQRISQKIKAYAAMAGESWYYSWQVKNKDGGKVTIEGPSINCAMAVASLFGNCQVDTTVQDNGHFWVFNARFVDIETGFSFSRPFQQRKSQTTGKMDADRQLDLAFQIGASKATRNVICKALSLFTDYAFDEAKKNLVDKVGRNLETYKSKILDRLIEFKVDLIRVEKVYDRKYADWRAQEVAKIIAEIQTINDGMATANDIYPILVDDIKGIEGGDAESQAEKAHKLFDELEVGLSAITDNAELTAYIKENQPSISALAEYGKEWAEKWATATMTRRASINESDKKTTDKAEKSQSSDFPGDQPSLLDGEKKK